MGEPQNDVPTFTNVPVVIVSTPLDVPEAQTAALKVKVPNYWRSQVFPSWFPCISAFQILGVFGLPSVTYTNPRHYIYLWSLFQTPIYMNVGRASSTSSLDRRTLKTASCEFDFCLALRKSARHLVSQTRSYSTYSVGDWQIMGKCRISTF
jgi:hypothetical protein